MSGDSRHEVLLVEDSHTDAKLMHYWLNTSPLTLDVVVVQDVKRALQFLRREADYFAAKVPSLVLLDLHLPDGSGLEVLAELRQDGRFHEIPIVMLTGDPPDMHPKRAAQLHAPCCVTKPTGAEEFRSLVRLVESLLRDAPRKAAVSRP